MQLLHSYLLYPKLTTDVLYSILKFHFIYAIMRNANVAQMFIDITSFFLMSPFWFCGRMQNIV